MTDPYFPANQTAIALLTQRMEKLEAENERLRAALKPFAEQYDAVEKEFGLLMLPDDANSIVRYADLRAARAALKEMGDE